MAKKTDDNDGRLAGGCLIAILVAIGMAVILYKTTGTTTAIIIGGVVGVLSMLIYVANTSADAEIKPNAPATEKPKSKQSSKPSPAQDTKVLTAHCRIAGISFRCTEADEGGFMGGVRLEPDNEHDPNAIAVYTNEGKHVGYVPRDKQAEVRAAMNGDDAAPCVGYIGTFGGRKKKNGVYGKIKIINTEDKNLMNIEAITFVAHVMNDEDEYAIPKEFASEPVTEEEWHKLIGRCHGMPWDDDFD